MVVLKRPPTFLSPSRRALLAGWRGLMIAAKLLLGSVLLAGSAWASEFDEYAVKAAYLYNFAKFVEWPPEAFANADAPLSICIVGDNPFGDALAALSSKRVASHPVEVRALPATANLNPCQIVFISRSEQGRFKALLAKVARLPILTVSDIRDFAQAGGMIGLIEADQRIRFDINLAATRQANLKLSSQLLKLATIVE
jgi:hypothetical protein